MFKKLRNTKKALILEGEDTWICGPPCNVDNKMDKNRCYLCQKWKENATLQFYSTPKPSSGAQNSKVAGISVRAILGESELTSIPTAGKKSEVAQQVSIQRRIIQRALERKLRRKKSSLDAANDSIDNEVAAAFNSQSGVLTCNMCRERGQAVSLFLFSLC